VFKLNFSAYLDYRPKKSMRHCIGTIIAERALIDKNTNQNRECGIVIKQTADETARLLSPQNKSARRNEPRADRETSVALSQRLCAYCQSGSDHFTSPYAIPDRSNRLRRCCHRWHTIAVRR
jgi:hypothetical protein